MNTADHILFKGYILAQNAYFDEGYANAFKYAGTNQILTRDGDNLMPVFPVDEVGNYFYLRSEGDIRFTAQFAERLTDNGAQRLTFLDTITVYLVAIVTDADVYKLINNLRNTAMGYKAMSVIPTAASYNREFIIADEMKGLDQDIINKALQNITEQTIVRLTLSVNMNYVPGNCIIDPCKSC